jgi:hypothetical protein
MNFICDADAPRDVLRLGQALVFDGSFETNHGISCDEDAALSDFFWIFVFEFGGKNEDFVSFDGGPFEKLVFPLFGTDLTFAKDDSIFFDSGNNCDGD